MTTRHALTLLFVLATFSLAQAQTKFSERTGGHCFQIKVPDYMIKTFELNDVASLQYINKSKGAFVIVIDDSKEELESLGIKFTDAKDFLESFVKDYKQEAKKRKLSKASTFAANGNQLASVELTWREDKEDFFMLITAVETDTHFYKILCWTNEANEESLKADYKEMSASLQD